jgi:PPP family 3-phenylpropionic acid transporter
MTEFDPPPQTRLRPDHPWSTLFHHRAFGCVTLVGTLVLGSHAMYDSFAVIHWSVAGISPAMIGLLWSESVAAEVLVFFFDRRPLIKDAEADWRIGMGGILRSSPLGSHGSND